MVGGKARVEGGEEEEGVRRKAGKAGEGRVIARTVDEGGTEGGEESLLKERRARTEQRAGGGEQARVEVVDIKGRIYIERG